jgi:hypothetical protein
MSTFTSPFTGTVIEPTDVSYFALTFSANTPLYWPAVVNPTEIAAARIMDCTPASAGLSILLPEADQGSVGSDILFNNKSSLYSFVVTDASGQNSTTISPGASVYFYLTNNSTFAGVWGNSIFGLNPSVASAATLAGAGLTTIAGQLATTGNIIDVTSPPTITNASRAATYVWNSGANTITLPAVSGLTAGWYISFRNNGTGTLTIQTQNTATINGNSSINTNPGDSGFILYDASTGNFVTVGWALPANVTFSSATYDVDSIVGNAFSLTAYAPIIQNYIAQSGTRTQTLLVTLPTVTQFYILANNTTSGSYNIEFQISGSSQTPISLGAGTIASVLATNNELFILTQSTVNVYQANNGSASAPSFSFLNDTHTGMYLIGTSALGFSANSTEMLQINNSNTSDPIITAYSTFIAINGIPGGGF